MNVFPIYAILGLWLTLATCERAPVVSTEEGKISGIKDEAVNGKAFYSYLGIPFAKSPVREMRFKDPVAAEKWDGVKDGSAMASPCLQVPFGAFIMGIKIPSEAVTGDEDCLYLNVHTPNIPEPKDNLPVMVFLHGGGFFAGGANEYLPHVLLSKDIILVVVQYRLGLMGFLSTEDSVIPGNFGLKDQTLALQWVQRNIRNFGGDPKRVTIFGESAGGASVHFQMLSPKAKGLFSGAIMQSGTALCPWAISFKHRKAAKDAGSHVGCSLVKGSQDFLRCMQSVSAQELTAFLQDYAQWYVSPMVAVPRIDGDFLPDHPARLMKEGRYNKVNLMTGINANEGAIFALPMYARAELIPDLKNNFPVIGPISLELNAPDVDQVKLTHQVYNYYLGGVNLEPENLENLVKLMGDHHFKLGHELVAQLHARETDVSTFMYELTHQGQLSLGDLINPFIGQHLVCHGDDLYYLFRGGPMLQPQLQPPERLSDLKSEDDLLVRNIILSLWTNFAANGNPTPDDSLLGFPWVTTSPDRLRHLNISPSPAMNDDSRKEVRKFHYSLPTDVNSILHPNLIKRDESASSSQRANQDEL